MRINILRIERWKNEKKHKKIKTNFSNNSISNSRNISNRRKYKLSGGVVTIDRTPSDISGEEGEKITLTATSADEEIATVVTNNDTNTVDVTAKKAGTTTITVKTTDGSNLSKTCEVTIVENVPDVATLTDIQTKNTVAKDENGNLIIVPRRL